MAKCPKCNEEITWLNHYQSGEAKYEYDGIKYEFDEILPDDGTLDYECPYCNEVLFTNEEGAKEFLENDNKT